MASRTIILLLIIVSQFLCTSLWFAGNAVLPNLIEDYHLPAGALAGITSAVQFGFICGTLLFALLSIADRFPPSRVFFSCAMLGSIANVCIVAGDMQYYQVMILRLVTGFSLAGIYPVGMKIAADYFEKGLGKALGFLVGALVLGTASPFLIKSLDAGWLWQQVMWATSTCAVVGGIIILVFVPNGPYRTRGTLFTFTNAFKAFANRSFVQPAVGYFGHMWELYTFWALLPVLIAGWQQQNGVQVNISFTTFCIIALGGFGCMVAGLVAAKFGAARIATIALLVSGTCCLLSPLIFKSSSPILFVGFLCAWGIAVVADSPLFSSLVAKGAPADIRGTALTIVNCIGFSITIVSIQLLNYLQSFVPLKYVMMILAIGPAIGVMQMVRNRARLI